MGLQTTIEDTITAARADRHAAHWELQAIKIESALTARLQAANESRTEANLLQELGRCTADDFTDFIGSAGSSEFDAVELDALRSLVKERLERREFSS